MTMVYPSRSIREEADLAECRIENNVYYFDIIPDPFEVDIAKVQDNIKCEDSAPDNGELRAVITRNGVLVNDYSDFAFQWYDGIGTANPIPAPAGTTNVLNGLARRGLFTGGDQHR
jgi:hypothetical protein